MRRLLAKLNNLFRSNHADLELDREVSAHLTLAMAASSRPSSSIARSAPSFGCPIQEYPAAGVAQALSPANSPIHRGASTNRSIAIRALRSTLTRSR
jgi:hypothetical protein